MLGVPRMRHVAVGGAIACWPMVNNTGDGGWAHVLRQIERDGSAGWPTVAGQPGATANAHPYLPGSQLALVHFGLNDLAILGSLKPRPFQEAMRTIMSRFCASAIWEDENTAWVRTGAWSPLGFAPAANSGSQVYYTTTIGDKAVFTLPTDFPGGRVVAIGLWINPAQAAMTYGLKVDGVDYPDIVADPAAICDTNSTGKYNQLCVRLGRGGVNDPVLGAGSHTIEVNLKAGPQLVVDYAQIEADPLDGPILLMPLPHKPLNYSIWNTWTHGPNAGTDPMNDAAVDTWKAAQRVVQAEFPGRVVEVELDGLGLNTAALNVGDGAHPNNAGHNSIAQACYDALKASGLITDRIRRAPVTQRKPPYWRTPGNCGENGFGSNWSNFGGTGAPFTAAPFGYFRDDVAGHRLRIRGDVKVSATTNATIWTIGNASLRPKYDRYFMIPYYNGSTWSSVAAVIVAATGAITIQGAVPTAAAGNRYIIDTMYEVDSQ